MRASCAALKDKVADQPNHLSLLDQLEPHMDARVFCMIRRAVKDMVEIQLSALKNKVADKEEVIAILKQRLADMEKALADWVADKDGVIASSKRRLADKEKALADWVADKEKALADRLADKEKALAGKEKALADRLVDKDELIELIKVAHALLINDKMSQLAAFRAQYDPRIMLDILYAGLEPAVKGKSGGKWQLLLRDVLRDGKLTDAAVDDLKDLAGLNDLSTVVSDLKSLSNRLSSAHHKGAADFEGTGWRLGVSSSPGLATALVVAALARIRHNHGMHFTLSRPVIYLNEQAKRHREFDLATLRWVS